MSSSNMGQEFKKLSEVDLRALRWVQSGKLESRLVSADQVVGSVRWSSGHGSLATAESSDGAWTFKRAGFLRPRITVRVVGSGSDLAVMKMGWGWEGFLHFADGSCYRFARLDFWHPAATVFDSGGAKVMSLKIDHTGREEETRVEMMETPASASTESTSLLALLSWYLVLLTSDYDYYGGLIGALVASGAI